MTRAGMNHHRGGAGVIPNDATELEEQPFLTPGIWPINMSLLTVFE